MNTERTIILENVGSCPIGLSDVQSRMYNLDQGAKMRISAIVLQDILDVPGSKTIFAMGLVKVSNVSREELYEMGLNEDEINLFLKEEKKIEKAEKDENKKQSTPVAKTTKTTTTKKTSTTKSSTKTK